MAATRTSTPAGSRPSGDSLVSAGLLLTVAPGLGYLIAWVEQAGYEQHFQVPLALIAPQLGTVLATTVTIALASVGIFAFAETYVSSRKSRQPGPVERRLLLILGLAVLLGLSMYLLWGWGNDMGPYPLVTYAALVVFTAILAFGHGILHPRSFRSRLERADKDRHPDPPSILSTALISRIGQVWFFLVPAILLVLLVAYDFGSFQAQMQVDYFVSDTSPPEVVVAIYGDTVVLAPFDKSKHLVLPEFDIVKLGTKLHLVRMAVGPLQTKQLTPRELS
jgi:hypothetical protein